MYNEIRTLTLNLRMRLLFEKNLVLEIALANMLYMVGAFLLG